MARPKKVKVEEPIIPEADQPTETTPEPEIPIQQEEKVELIEETIEPNIEEKEQPPTTTTAVIPVFIPPAPTEDLSKEDRILNYLDSRQAGEIKMNDFLKSLFPIAKFNEPPTWLNQASSKILRVLLTTMVSQGKIEVQHNSHVQLGTAHYPDTTTMKTAYHTLNTVPIIAIKK